MNITLTRKTVLFTVGLPASGKTKWTDAQIEADDTGLLVAVSRDGIRRALRAPFGKAENLVTEIQRYAIAGALARDLSVIVDDTNLNPLHLAALRDHVVRHGGDYAYVTHFLATPLETCIERDSKRWEDEHVGAEVITRLNDRHVADWPMLRAMLTPAATLNGDRDLTVTVKPCAG